MKECRIDVSGFTGKVRRVINEALIRHAALIGYKDGGMYTENMFTTDCLAFWNDGDITWGEPSDKVRFALITAADFLALETAKEPEFKPFDKVLVSHEDHAVWRAGFYSHTTEEGLFVTTSGYWKRCIPYEGNEHLIGTIDSPE